MKRLIFKLSIFSLLLCSCEQNSETTDSGSAAAYIKLHSPLGPVAGNDLHLLVKTEQKNPIEITLILDNGVTFHTRKIRTAKKVILKGELLKQAGINKLMIKDGEQILCTRQFRIQPAQIIDPLEIHTGPRTIIVGGLQTAMTTTIPSDAYNNGINSSEIISYKWDNEPLRERRIKHMIAWDTLVSGKNKKKVLLGVSHNSSASEEQHITQIADFATNFNIELIELHGFSDNRHYAKIRTSVIKDRYGNLIADGTQVSFQITENSRLIGQYNSMVIDGSSTVYIRNPDKPSRWQIQGRISEARSNKLDLRYKRNIRELNYSIDSFLKRITLGPLQGAQYQHIPDGTEITVIKGDEVRTYKSYKGKAIIDLREFYHTEAKLITIQVEDLIETISL